jgi:hypothetical protein
MTKVMDRATEIDLLTSFSENIKRKILDLGLNVTRVDDFKDLSIHLKSQNAVINPSFDPHEHTIKEGFWLRVENKAGKVVACHAERIFRTTDFVAELIETGSLWWQKNQPVSPQFWRSDIVFASAQLNGSVAYAGSMLIDPSYRGIGISRYLPFMSRAIALQEFCTSFHTGIVRQSLAASKVPRKSYGFSKVDLLFSGTLPGVKGPKEDVYLCWMDRAEALTTLSI